MSEIIWFIFFSFWDISDFKKHSVCVWNIHEGSKESHTKTTLHTRLN